MRLRTRSAAAAVAAVLAVGGLTGCRTNVGVAATVEGHRITQSDVNRYVSASSQPFSSSSGGAATAPRPFVLSILLTRRLFEAVLRKTPKGVPSTGELATVVTQQLRGRSYQQAAVAFGVKGYRSSFNRLLVETIALDAQLRTDAQAGVNVDGVFSTLRFPVSVNPRYGAWDSKTKNLTSTATSGLPGFVTLQPLASAAAPSQQPAG